MKAHIILDLGSQTIKSGLSTFDLPDISFPSAYPIDDHAHPINSPINDDSEVDFAIIDGEVNNEDRMTFVLASLFDRYFPEDKPQPDELKISFTDMPLSSRSHAAYLAQTCFELLGSSEITIKPPALNTIMTQSIQTGVCVDIGYDISHVVSIAHNFVIPKACNRSFLAGSALDLFTARYQLHYTDVKYWKQFKTIESTKRQLIQISSNFENEIDNANDDKCYGLTCGELLFNPILFEAAIEEGNVACDERISTLMEEPSIAQLITNSINDCDLPVRGDLWQNIIVTGGGSLIPGFRSRLQNELSKLCPQGRHPNIRFIEDPVNSSWCGSKILSQFQEQWMTKEEYDEDPTQLESKFNIYYPPRD